MTGAQYLVAALQRHGVRAVFGYPGGAIMPVYDALVDGDVRHVLMRHEQGAALAADGYARATGEVGVCIATSGPGATNLITGIANAYMDSIPLLAITGQVSLALIGTDAFQEVDILGMTQGITKHGFLVEQVDDLPRVIGEAFRLAREGRPGPVLIDLPKDVAGAELSPKIARRGLERTASRRRAVENTAIGDHSGRGAAASETSRRAAAGALDVARNKSPRDAAGPPDGARQTSSGGAAGPPDGARQTSSGGAADPLDSARRLLRQSRRPLVYAGGGVALGNLVQPLRDFLATTGIPIVTSLHGLGAVPTDDPQFLGMLGMHGGKAANLAVQACDLLLCVGARFDDRATGNLERFAPGATTVQLDVDAAEVGKLRAADVAVVAADLRPALAGMSIELTIDDWRRRCSALRTQHAPCYDAPGDGVYAPAFLRRLSTAAGPEATVVCDVGQHQMWVAQHCGFSRPEKHLSSGGLGTMGFGLPAAIGALVAGAADPVILVTGDGSFMMNVQELATLARYRLNLKIVVLDNHALGLVRQWQELFFDGRFSEIDLSDNPEFDRLAHAFGIPSMRVQQRSEVDGAIAWLLAVDGPVLAHVPIDARDNVWPLVPPGAGNDTMLEGSR